ncbi:hypothetical protein KAR91_07100 [Candidatus Pacearchaeota archaeon]|nr:hypothetical protein [Candidatus Pacearchaeota archaeon]
MSNTQQAIIKLILAERQHQDIKWGKPNHDPFIWQTILTEEVGEVAHEVLAGVGHTNNLKDELIQVAAVAVAWLEVIIECENRMETNQ